jgi:DNA-binding LacI/PurR family transcriptional regulator
LQQSEIALLCHRSRASVWRIYRGDEVSELVRRAITQAAAELGLPPPPQTQQRHY